MISQNAREDEELVGVWASRLQKWGFEGLMPLAGDLLRPVAFLGAQALHLFSPILTTFAPRAEVERLARLLESPESIDLLTDSLAHRPSRQEPSDQT